MKMLHVLPFYDYSFSGDGFYYNLNSLDENVNRNDWDHLKKRGMHFIHMNINSLAPKLDEVHNIANITNTPIIE